MRQTGEMSADLKPRDMTDSESGRSPAAEKRWRPKYNPWLIGSAVSLAAFMEVLDTSIANVALPYMAGSLGASNDESTWVLTSYLVSNAIVLPISGWLAEVTAASGFSWPASYSLPRAPFCADWRRVFRFSCSRA
jgi:MFS family permease